MHDTPANHRLGAKGALAAGAALLGLGFLAFQVGLAFAPGSEPAAAESPFLRLPEPGSTLAADVPSGVRWVLALSSCESCSLNVLDAAVVRRASARADLPVLAPDDKPRPELKRSSRPPLLGASALAFGPWASSGPVLVGLDAAGKVATAVSGPAEVTARLGGLR